MYKFLTYAPLTKKLRAGEWEELSIFDYYLSGPLTYRQRSYLIAGGYNDSVITPSIYTGRSTVRIYPQNPNPLPTLTRIEFWIEYQGVRVTEIRTFTPDFTARKKPVRIGWNGTLGGVNYYTFTGSKTSEVLSDKVLYMKDLPVAFTAQNRVQSVANSTYQTEFEVTSDYETEDVYLWLCEVIASSNVWVVENGICIPVVITTKSVPVESDNLFQFRMKYKKSSDKIVQNG